MVSDHSAPAWMYYSFLALFLVVPLYAALRFLRRKFLPKAKEAVHPEKPSAVLPDKKEWVPGPKAILVGKIFDCFSEALLLPCFGLLGVAVVRSFVLISGGALQAINLLGPVFLAGFFLWFPTYVLFFLPSAIFCFGALFPKLIPHVRLVMFCAGVMLGFYPDLILHAISAIMGHNAVEAVRGAPK